MVMNWRIGQPIVAIKNHSQGRFKKGDEFIIKGLRTSSCFCPSKVLIDVGLPTITGRSGCKCGFWEVSKIVWFNSTSFAPLDANISELTEILEMELVNV